MKPGALDIVRPASLAEAVEALAGAETEAKVLAGGQSLVPMLNLRMVSAELLVDLRDLADLKTAEDKGDHVRIGAGVTHARIQSGALPDPSNGLLPAMAARIAYQPVRNRGTFGGSLALADPAADWPAACVALNAVIEWIGPDGPAECPAGDFVLGPYMTRLGLADVLTGARIPRLSPGARWGTYKLVRKTGEFAHAMAIVVREPGAPRAVLGATGGPPLRLAAAERAIAGLTAWSPDAARPLGAAFDEDVAAAPVPLEDVHAWQLKTCLLRAAAASFGAAPAGPRPNGPGDRR